MFTLKDFKRLVKLYGQPSYTVRVPNKCIVTFSGATVEVYSIDPDGRKDPVLISPREDGKYNLTKSSYKFNASSTGYVTQNDVNLVITAADILTGTKTVNIVLVPETYSLSRTATSCTISVTKNSEAVSDGEDVISYGDSITIQITPDESTILGEVVVTGTSEIPDNPDWATGEELTVIGDVTISGSAE